MSTESARPEKSIALRFDVDSHRCIAVGVPALLDLGRELDVQFTFFVNFGRLTSRPRAIQHALTRRVRSAAGATPTTAAKLPLRSKLGTPGFATALTLNPRAGANHLDVVRRAAAEGHDVGLHGGSNHRVWQDEAPTWPRGRLGRELDWGLRYLRKVGLEPSGFSSPGWSSSPDLSALLAERNFTYTADRHGPAEGDVRLDRSGLADVPTNMAGEPGGVGWLEWRRALGEDDGAMSASFRKRLDELEPVGLAVLYDHPFNAGTNDIAMTRRLIVEAQQAGWEFTTMDELALRAEQP